MKKFLSIFLLFILLMPTCLTFASSEPQPNPDTPQIYEHNGMFEQKDGGRVTLVRTYPEEDIMCPFEPVNKRSCTDGQDPYIVISENEDSYYFLAKPTPITMSGDEK